MNKLTYILILSFLCICCGQNQDAEKETSNEKPIQTFSSFRLLKNELVEYDIDTLTNFNEILKILDEIDCLQEYVVFKIDTGDKIFKIQPLQMCEDIFDYKLRQILYINADSITINHKLKFPIDSLQTILKNHLVNPNNNENYPLEKEIKLISITIDGTKNIRDTKNLLLKIISIVNELEHKVNFSFMFESHGIIEVVEE